jgi:hypothetical protein
MNDEQIKQAIQSEEAPAVVEELTIEELAVREEYSACYTTGTGGK